MPESSADPMIKLFGRTIPLPPPPPSPPPSGEAPAGSGSEGNREEEEDLQHKEASPESVDRDSPDSEERIEPPPPRPPPPSSTARESPKPAKASRAEEPASETNSSQEKTMKKPDKIIPCPRCKSMDTKFCYYNNYNVNQPRHFCKNCQRYWTAGGTMRNVPVGAGRRRNKSSASPYRHITMSDACLQAVRSDAPQPILHPPSKPGGTVLSFGSDMPLCESMASALNLADKTMKNAHQNGSRRMDETIIPFSCGVDNGDEHLSGSSVANPNSNEVGTGVTLQEPRNPSPQLVPAPLPYLNGSPWPYPWSPAPAFCTPGFSIPFYPAPAYWGCTLPGAWTIPWLSPVASASPRGDSSMSSGPNSPSLGKHSREGDVPVNSNSEGGDDAEQSRQERCLWVPKTLRIDNPDEAAKSSIWAMMGLQNDKTDATSRGELFKAFQPKVNTKTLRAGGSEVLHANPAALSRSVSFQESA